MSTPRPAEIERLSSVMLDAMQADARNASSSEVISAVMSLALSTILAVKQAGGNVEALRPVVEALWNELPSQKVNG